LWRLGLLESEKPARADRDLLWRALAGRAATDLAAALERESSPLRFDQLQRWLSDDEPSGAVILFDAGTLLYTAGFYPAAADVFRWLLAEYPLSPVAPEAGLRLFAALDAAGASDLAEAVAWQLAGDLAPGSDWNHAQLDEELTAVPLLPLAGRTKTAAAVREWLLRRLRDGEFFLFSRNQEPPAIAAAERAARLLLDTIENSPHNRADWLALGKILTAAGKTDEAAKAFANVSLDEIEDALRLEALRELAGVVKPDVRRLANALGDDPWVEWLAMMGEGKW
jgi:tetratricopeptide (TPR) repeat protein